MIDDSLTGMPWDMAVRARQNLRAVDRMNSSFNERARAVATPIVTPTAVPAAIPTVPVAPVVTPPSSLSLSAPIDTSIGAPLPTTSNAVSRISPPVSAAVPSTGSMSAAYNQIASVPRQPKPVQPLVDLDSMEKGNYSFAPNPRTKKLQSQYGWGN